MERLIRSRRGRNDRRGGLDDEMIEKDEEGDRMGYRLLALVKKRKVEVIKTAPLKL